MTPPTPPQDYTFDSITIENTKPGKDLLRVWIKPTAAGATIRNITFRNITVLNPTGNKIRLTAGPGTIAGVTFDHVVLGGKPILSAADPRIVNEGATGIVVIP
jgi:hypothetical protein